MRWTASVGRAEASTSNVMANYIRASSTTTRKVEREWRYTLMATFTWVISLITRSMAVAPSIGSVSPLVTLNQINLWNTTMVSGGAACPMVRECIKRSLVTYLLAVSRMASNMDRGRNIMEMAITM